MIFLHQKKHPVDPVNPVKKTTQSLVERKIRSNPLLKRFSIHPHFLNTMLYKIKPEEGDHAETSCTHSIIHHSIAHNNRMYSNERKTRATCC